ncbi:MAG: hypothetical protein QG579_35 [Patescibacteria group bacterium]|jgi:hypothetical protein|nr:hypothetical protein [Patescibacteria group bacterium]
MKKISVFFDRTLREALKMNSEWSIAYHAALNFLAVITAYGTDPQGTYMLSLGHPQQDCKVGFNKFVCGCHHESQSVREMFNEAHRVEVCLTLRWYKALTLELKAYRVGAKDAYLSLEFIFNQEGSPVAAMGTRQGS